MTSPRHTIAMVMLAAGLLSDMPIPAHKPLGYTPRKDEKTIKRRAKTRAARKARRKQK